MTDWHPEDVKAILRKRGTSLAALADSLAVSRQAMSQTLVRPWARGEQAIASFLNVPAQTIWPSRYHSDGTRRRPQPANSYAPKPRFAAESAHA